MRDLQGTGVRPTRLWVYTGASIFLIALMLSAILVPELRVLHFFQAWIYIAVILLTRRNSAWGYGAGFSIGIAWNAIGLFVSRLILTGAVALWSSLRHGHIENPVPMTVFLGGIGHFILIAACLIAALRLDRQTKRWWKFAAGGAAAIAYFALIISFTHPH